MGGAQFAEGIAVGQIGNGQHLLGAHIARGGAACLQREKGDGIARHPVGLQVALGPGGKGAVFCDGCGVAGVGRRIGAIGRGHKAGLETGQLGGLDLQRAILDSLPLGLHFFAEGGDAGFLHQDLDARLVDVVAPAEQVVNPQDGLAVAEQIHLGQKLTDFHTDDGRAAQPAAHKHAVANLARRVLHYMHADVVHGGGGAVAGAGRESKLEFARQPVEFGVKCCPLAGEFAVGARVEQFVLRHAGEMVGCDIANAVAAGLYRVHLHGGKVGEDVGHRLQRGPVVLDVLAGGEVAVALVVLGGDVRQHAQLLRRNQTIGNGHAQHGCKALEVEAVAQAQMLEFVGRNLAGQKAGGLVAEFGNPRIHQLLVNLVVTIHRASHLAGRAVCGDA